jgi:riboflavin kinase / FMN adenylyltransferase
MDGAAGKIDAATGVQPKFMDVRYEGVALHGAKLGRTLGFPTANIALRGAHPDIGIYAARVRLADGEVRAGVAYFGSRPSVDGQGELLEVFIFDFTDDLYGRHLSVELVAFIRPDVQFSGLEAVRLQTVQDCVTARHIPAR